MSLTRLAIATAPVLFVLLWSTGFIGARYGLPYIEPLTFLAVRMVFVVVIMAAIAVIGGAKPPDAGEVGHSLVAGLLVHGLYLGGVFTAISQGVPAGISALIPGVQPILTSTIANRFIGETVTRIQWVGLALGLVGVLLGTARSRHHARRLYAWLDCELPVAHRYYAGDALSKALLRRNRLAFRKSRSICRRGSVVRFRRLCV